MVDPNPSKQLAMLEQRCRRSTGMVLAGVAFVASYSLIFFAQPGDGRLNFFPPFLALLFYVAGDLLALIWIRVVASHIKEMLLDQLDDLQDVGVGSMAPDPEMSPGDTDSQVEVVKPGEGGQ